ncbi:aspartyl protease family protein [Roseateles chitinivorans]|uniref:aspartyl protease family protein n=1 Tax=Roseateles chitinivorans TaxID=2917965 RepID=UPI003D678346
MRSPCGITSGTLPARSGRVARRNGRRAEPPATASPVPAIREISVQGQGRAGLRQWIGVLCALAASASSAWAGLSGGTGIDAGTQVVAPTCRLQTATVPVQVVHYRLIAVAKINGRSLAMMVNTSSEYSFLSPEVVRGLGLSQRPLPQGLEITNNGLNLPAQMTTVRRFNSGTLDLKDVDFVVADIDSGLSLSGVIGRDLLASRDIEFDVSRGVIRLITTEGDCRREALAFRGGSAPVNDMPLSDPEGADDRRIRIPIELNGRPVVAMLASGVQFSALQPHAARAAGIPDRDLRSPVAPDGSATRIVEVERVQVGAERFSRQQLEVEPYDAQGSFDMLLGVDYLLSHRVYVSHAQRRLYSIRNGFPAFRNRDGYLAGGPDAQAWEKAWEGLQQEPETWAGAALFHYRFKRLREAIDAMNRAIALDPGVADFYVTRARAQRALGDLPAAGKDAEEALRLDPALDDARLIRADVQVLRGSREEALPDLALLDSRLPSDADARSEMAWLYGKAGRVTESIRQWTMWIESHPEDVYLGEGYNERCFHRTLRNIDLPLALQDCERATALGAPRAEFLDSLGWTRLRLGDLVGARSAFDAAIRLQADQAWSLYGRSLVWARQGDAARARADLEAARGSKSDIDQRVKESGLPHHEGAV